MENYKRLKQMLIQLNSFRPQVTVQIILMLETLAELPPEPQVLLQLATTKVATNHVITQ